MATKISVLLTSYNKDWMLERAIKSVLDQTLQDFELVLLEDNSNRPETQAVVSKYLYHPKIIVYKSNIEDAHRMEYCRYAVNTNIGLQIATGKYIAYLCDDDFFLPIKLEKIVAFFDANPDKHACYGIQRGIRDGKMLSAIRYPDRILDHPAGQLDHSQVCTTKEAALKVGGWDIQADYWGAADAQFFMKLVKAGYLFYPIGPVETDVHEYQPDSIQAGGAFKWMIK